MCVLLSEDNLAAVQARQNIVRKATVCWCFCATVYNKQLYTTKDQQTNNK